MILHSDHIHSPPFLCFYFVSILCFLINIHLHPYNTLVILDYITPFIAEQCVLSIVTITVSEWLNVLYLLVTYTIPKINDILASHNHG